MKLYNKLAITALAAFTFLNVAVADVKAGLEDRIVYRTEYSQQYQNNVIHNPDIGSFIKKVQDAYNNGLVTIYPKERETLFSNVDDISEYSKRNSVSMDELAKDLSAKDNIIVGEMHNSKKNKHFEFELFRQLHKRNPKIVVAMELLHYGKGEKEIAEYLDMDETGMTEQQKYENYMGFILPHKDVHLDYEVVEGSEIEDWYKLDYSIMRYIKDNNIKVLPLMGIDGGYGIAISNNDGSYRLEERDIIMSSQINHANEQGYQVYAIVGNKHALPDAMPKILNS